jgi:hypothetical protein
MEAGDLNIGRLHRSLDLIDAQPDGPYFLSILNPHRPKIIGDLKTSSVKSLFGEKCE